MAAGALLFWAGAAHGQVEPTFRTGTTLIEVSAIVTRDGEPVRGLMIDEVEVYEDGRRQPLVAFEFVDLTTVEGPEQRRDFVLVLDDRHISPPQTRATRDFARTFIDSLGPHDRLAVVNTGSKEFVHQLSTDREESRALVGRVHGELTRFREAAETEFHAHVTFEVLRRVAAVLQRQGPNERRTVVLVSEGHSVLPNDPRDRQDVAVRQAYRAVLRYASTANVAVYAVDPRGLMADQPVPVSREPVTDARAAFATSRSGLPTSLAQELADAMAARRFGSLGQMAYQTGGLLTVDRNDLQKDIPRIIQDSRQYYRLVYVQPDAEGAERRTRRIDVKVSRPGVEVRARREYH